MMGWKTYGGSSPAEDGKPFPVEIETLRCKRDAMERETEEIIRVDRDVQPKDGYHNFEVEENNHSDDDRNVNDIWDGLEVIRESPSNDYNGDVFTTPPRTDFNQGTGEENQFTNEHLLSSVGSTSRVVPIDIGLNVDQVFDTKKELQEVVHMIALKYNFQFKTKKSNKNVYTIVCVDENCKWRLHATKFKDSDYFQIRKYTPEHTCALNLSTNDHRQARSWIIGKHIMSSLRIATLHIDCDVANEIRQDFGIEINYQKARRSRETALAYIRGSPEDSYTKLAAYAHNLKVANPGTIYSLEVDSENRFKYFFLAYGPVSWVSLFNAPDSCCGRNIFN
ncbi:hypothetical protein DH2020_004303 [Rehmannia glutinosa]|uniref:Transposase MuDR plant domain-containing protein n=1 Tax=Rehmannia glutinosa TaxID=99300 RepID=A0ABR0XP34_REHGL